MSANPAQSNPPTGATEHSLAPSAGSVLWLPGWYATKLHALPATVNLPFGHSTAKSVCGAYVYGKAPTDWAQRNVDKGLARCKHCERKLAPNVKAEP